MASRDRNYYELLGVAPNASAEEIHSAYRTLARRFHPDVNAGAHARDRFHELSDAYEVLHDPDQRADYDRSRRTRSRATGVSPKPRVSSKPRAPFFTPARPRRDVPRFLDEPGGLGVRLDPQRGLRVQLMVRWWR